MSNAYCQGMSGWTRRHIGGWAFVLSLLLSACRPMDLPQQSSPSLPPESTELLPISTVMPIGANIPDPTGEPTRSLLHQRLFSNTDLSNRAITGMAVSPNGQQIAFISWGLAVELFDIAKELENGNWALPEPGADEIRAVAFEPSGQYLVVGDDVGNVYMLETNYLEALFNRNYGSPIVELAFTPDGRYLGVATEPREGLPNVHFWAYPDLYELEATGQACTIQSGRNDDEFYLSVKTSEASSVKLLRVDENATSDFGSNTSLPCPFSSTEGVLVGVDGGVVHAWAIDGDSLVELQGDWANARSADVRAIRALAGPGQQMVVFYSDNSLTWWNVADRTELLYLPDPIQAATFAPDGSLIVASDGVIERWSSKAEIP